MEQVHFKRCQPLTSQYLDKPNSKYIIFKSLCGAMFRLLLKFLLIFTLKHTFDVLDGW